VARRTGASRSVRWVSVIAARATQAEVLTKTVFVAGAVDGRRIVEDNGCYAVIVDDDAVTFEAGCVEELAA
jgi:thiamine biosynthesis lipoprotein ApbE